MLGLTLMSVWVTSALTAVSVSQLDRQWLQFKTTFNKTYTVSEEPFRRAIWEENLGMITQHNLRADQGLTDYRQAMNHLGDMTRQEVADKMNGYRMAANRTAGTPYRLQATPQSSQTIPQPTLKASYPTEIDWRTRGYVTAVKNQEQCGSCWAFSAIGSLEGQQFRKTGRLVALSEQNLVDCSTEYGNLGCDGGLMDYAFQYIIDNNGVDTEASYPYRAKQGECRFDPANVGATVRGYVDIPQGSEDSLLVATATVGPIAAAMDASQLSFQFYQAGVYYEPECSPTELDHGVLVVGYGRQDGQDYWLVKNSYGTEWGDDGYIKMARNKDNNCGIATLASYPLV